MFQKQSQITQAVILAGGRGERLRPLTDNCPKPMILIHDRPFLEYGIDILRKNGIEEILLLLGYLPERFVRHFGDGSRFGLRITYHIGAEEDDTSTRVRNAKNLLNEKFLLMYGDVYWPSLDLKKMGELYDASGKQGLIVVCDKGESRSNVWVDEENNVLDYAYGPDAKNPKFNWTEVGVFMMNRNMVDCIPERDNVNLNKTILPDLAARGELIAWKTDKAPDTITCPAHVSAFAEKMKFLSSQ